MKYFVLLDAKIAKGLNVTQRRKHLIKGSIAKESLWRGGIICQLKMGKTTFI